MIYSIDETKEIIETVQADDSLLSPWERGFFDDLDPRDAKFLTPKQREIVGRVWDEKYKHRPKAR